MSDMHRRDFLSTGWKVAAGLLAAAGLWTSWDLIRSRPAAGFGGVVRAVSPDAVPSNTVLAIPQARAYLTRVDDEVVALSEKCTHLNCRVPFVDETGRFECPCHGSAFTREGFYVTGPAPRGLDRFEIQIVDGIIEIDTDDVQLGPPPGSEPS